MTAPVRVRDDVLDFDGHSVPETPESGRAEDPAMEAAWAAFEEEQR